MNVIHAMRPLTKSIFLAGPTPRDETTESWRPLALQYLTELKYDGTVFVPESSDWLAHNNYDAQIYWEWEAINQATRVVFWIPRTLDTMPAFTTNIEFGLTVASGKAILGYPDDAVKMRYIDSLARKHSVPVINNLRFLLSIAVDEVNKVHFESWGRFQQQPTPVPEPHKMLRLNDSGLMGK